jgi:hypothetical protein
MGYVRALLNYFTAGKGRRDALDYLKAGVVMVGVMAICRLILLVAKHQ